MGLALVVSGRGGRLVGVRTWACVEVVACIHSMGTPRTAGRKLTVQLEVEVTCLEDWGRRTLEEPVREGSRDWCSGMS